MPPRTSARPAVLAALIDGQRKRLQNEKLWDQESQALLCDGPPVAPGTGATPREMMDQARQNAKEAPNHRSLYPVDTAFWFRSQVKNKGPWDYKQYDPGFENFGNYNYGYVGAAAGIPTGVLLRQAGKAQRAAGTSRRDWGTPGNGLWGGEGSYGDDPIDQTMIKRGIRDRQNGC